jgi:2-polyprenyl-3-methyl-5-hydroxy-6-metoxy-1,4-benzoquinol methylase
MDSVLRERVSSFDEKHYRFVDFAGLGDFPPPQRSPTRSERDQRMANRHAQRYRYFFEPLLRLNGGSLQGHRILDLGCNAGYWSLKAAEAGADFVLGVDGRAIHVDHANLVLEAAGVEKDRYRFDVGNVLELATANEFDIALCLGLLYHVAKPVELFEAMVRAGAEIIVIDTEVSTLPGSLFQVMREPLDERTNAIDYEMVLYPTRQAVIDLANQFGFAAVPLALDVTDWREMDNYRDGGRVAFMCAKTVDLSQLSREAPPVTARTGIKTDVARLARRIVRGTKP